MTSETMPSWRRVNWRICCSESVSHQPSLHREDLRPDRREDTFSVQSCSMFLSTDSATLQCLFLTADESSSSYLNPLSVYLTKRAIDHTSLQEWRRLCVRIPREDLALLDCRTERYSFCVCWMWMLCVGFITLFKDWSISLCKGDGWTRGILSFSFVGLVFIWCHFWFYLEDET